MEDEKETTAIEEEARRRLRLLEEANDDTFEMYADPGGGLFDDD